MAVQLEAGVRSVNIGVQLAELRYWHIDRKTQKVIPWIARNLPEPVKYHVVIHGMVQVADGGTPGDATGMELLELWSNEKVD